MRLVALTEDRAEAAAGWFMGDPEGSAEFGGFYGVHPKWWTLVERDEHRRGWIAIESSSEVGFVDLEVAGSAANFAIYIMREWRGRGLGTALVGLVADAAVAEGVVRLVGEAAPSNEPSLRAMRTAGFADVGSTDQGYLRLERLLA